MTHDYITVCPCGGTRFYTGTYAFPRTARPQHHYACDRLEDGRDHDGAWAFLELDDSEAAEWDQALATEALRLAFEEGTTG
jgi:hypothetical protein